MVLKFLTGDKFITYCAVTCLPVTLQSKIIDMKHLIITLTVLISSISIMAQTTVKTYDRLTDETVGILCHAAKEKSVQMGLDISFAICDADGLPRLFCRFGDALVLSTILVPANAYTAAVTHTPTEALGEFVADGGNLMGIHTTSDKITLVPGGIPLFRDGKIIGAIGVGGGTKEQDLEIANSIVAKFNELNAKL